MSIREIVLFSENEAALRQKSEPVRVVNRRIKKLIQDLKETMVSRPDGIGLAAPQINVHSRVTVVRLNSRNNENNEPDPPIALINPEIVEARNDNKDSEGCLSLPGLVAEVVRPHYVRVTGLDEWGKPFDRVFEGYDAVLVHHEIDHLDGVLFIDRIESVADLYRVERDENGKLVRVPVAPQKLHG
jgi:peptide deformylase